MINYISFHISNFILMFFKKILFVLFFNIFYIINIVNLNKINKENSICIKKKKNYI